MNAPTTHVPGDTFDEQLLDTVRPAQWVNPTAAPAYHLVVIGAGTGGLVTAAAAAGLGARVALVEKSLMGGDCLNFGCVPSKLVIRGARAWNDTRDGAHRFGAPRAVGDGNFAAVMERMRRVRAAMAPIDGAQRFRDLGVDVFLGAAAFVDANTVLVGDQHLRFRRAVVATGARARVPSIPGLPESGFHTNETIFSLTQRPASMVVIGAGAVGCELAQAFARLGTTVTLLKRDAQLLTREAPEASMVVERALVRDGVIVQEQVQVERVERSADERVVYARSGGAACEFHCDVLLVAVGRAPNVEGMGLERAGITYDTSTGVRVDDHLRTTNRRVYAVGDVCAPLKFTHAADFQARMVVQNALFFGRGKASALVTPRVTFTSPEVASVGTLEHDAIDRGIAVDTVTVPLHDVDRARMDDEDSGFCTMVLARGTDRIIGATIVAEHAGETIGEVVLAMNERLGLSAIGRAMHPYPTQAEVLRKAADTWRRRKLTPRVSRLFAAYFRWVLRL